MPGSRLLLLSYLAYLAQSTSVFWALKDHVIRNSSLSFQCDKWELLQNLASLCGSMLDLLIQVRELAEPAEE